MKVKSKNRVAIFQAILAAALYAISMPLSKLFLREIPPMMMAAFLYLGAGIGMSVVGFIRHKTQKEKTEAKLTKKELPYTIAMVLLDIAAPICLMFGLTLTTSANASLLNNFEIVATAIIALSIFKEAISRRLWIAIALITLSSILLTVEDTSIQKSQHPHHSRLELPSHRSLHHNLTQLSFLHSLLASAGTDSSLDAT